MSDFLDETRPELGQGQAGVLTALQRGVAPGPSGIAIGFDELGWDYGSFHSYVCNGLENEFASVLGIAGFLRTNVRTLENWEQGRAKPNAQASLLIKLVEAFPNTIQRLQEI